MDQDRHELERIMLERELKELQAEQLNHNLPKRIKRHIELEIDRIQKLLILNIKKIRYDQ